MVRRAWAYSGWGLMFEINTAQRCMYIGGLHKQKSVACLRLRMGLAWFRYAGSSEPRNVQGGSPMSLSISMIVGLLAATLLLAQGVATLRQPNVSPADKWLGWLTILIAALGLLAQILLYKGTLVFTPQF